MPNNCFSVIIAGGKGTRFWPLSRAGSPKQLLKILSRKSLIEETAERVYALGGRAQTLVVTIADQVAALRRELRDLPKSNFLAEPQGKNTAPCIGLAALELVRRNPAAVMIVLPADHWVRDRAAFRRTLKAAVGLALQNDQLITIGIRPDYPETGYGYIMKGKSVSAKPADCFSGKTIYGKTDTRFGTTAGAPARSVEQRNFRLESFHGTPSVGPLSAGDCRGIGIDQAHRRGKIAGRSKSQAARGHRARI